MKKRCSCCKKRFRPDRYHPNQQYCPDSACQRCRRNRYQKEKLKTDADYRANQSDVQERWRKSHAEYWKAYRQNHPAYTERNRALCRERHLHSAKKSAKNQAKDDFAKMDFALPQLPIKSGRYKIQSCDEGGDAKMNVAIVQLSILEPLTKTG